MNISKTTQKYHDVLFIGIGLIVLIALVVFLLNPQLGHLRQNFSSYSQANTQLSNINNEISELESLKERAGSFSESEQAKLAKAFPSENQLEEFLVSLHDMARKTNIVISSVNLSEPRAGDRSGYLTSNLSLSIRGSYANFLNFLHTIENHARLIDINNLSIGSATADMMTFSLSGQVYVLAPIPESPLFPFGKNFSTYILEEPQFVDLEAQTVVIPQPQAGVNNPFVGF